MTARWLAFCPLPRHRPIPSLRYKNTTSRRKSLAKTPAGPSRPDMVTNDRVFSEKEKPDIAVLRIFDAAQALQTTPRTVRRLVREGALGSVRFGPRSIRIPASALSAFLAVEASR